MSFFERIYNLVTMANEADDEDFIEEDPSYDPYEEEEDEPEEVQPEPRRMQTTRVTDRNNKVVSIHASQEVKVVIVRPRKVDEAANIAEHIRERRTVVLNLERTDKNISRRIMDFLMGAAYVTDGDFKKIAANTFIITPKNVGVVGAEAVDSDVSGMYSEATN